MKPPDFPMVSLMMLIFVAVLVIFLLGPAVMQQLAQLAVTP